MLTGLGRADLPQAQLGCHTLSQDEPSPQTTGSSEEGRAQETSPDSSRDKNLSDLEALFPHKQAALGSAFPMHPSLWVPRYQTPLPGVYL